MNQSDAINAINGVVGTKQVTVFGYTNPYGAQCVALDAWYFALLGYTTHIMPGYNAIDVYNKNPLGLTRIAAQALQPGDVFFMNYVSGGVNYGHTGLVKELTGQGFNSVDQNWYDSNAVTGSPAAIVSHPFSSIVGGLRPQFKQEVTMVDEGTLRWIYEQATGSAPPQDYLDQRVGKFTPMQCIEEIINAPSAVAFRASRSAPSDADNKINQIKEIVNE